MTEQSDQTVVKPGWKTLKTGLIVMRLMIVAY